MAKPKANKKLDEKVNKLKVTGLSFSEIGKIMGVSKTMAHRRYVRFNVNGSVDKLS